MAFNDRPYLLYFKENAADSRFFDRETFVNSLQFPRYASKITTRINTFDRPLLYTYYLKGWKYVDY